MMSAVMSSVTSNQHKNSLIKQFHTLQLLKTFHKKIYSIIWIKVAILLVLLVAYHKYSLKCKMNLKLRTTFGNLKLNDSGNRHQSTVSVYSIS